MAAAARPYWTGFLKLSPVTIAARLYSATTEKERIHFHRMDALKRSLAEEGAEKPAGKRRPRSAKSSKAQPSLLLPVRGGLADKPKAQSVEAPRRRKKAS
jgi:hypothetical protein